MLKNIFYQIFSFLYFTSFGQQMPVFVIGEVPEMANECSGITKLPSGNYAMINDSGNEPEVFITDSTGTLIKRIYLDGVCNIDWEEVQYDNGHLYIGDFGNNKNARTDLTILKYAISNTDSLSDLELIKYKYAEQRDFPETKKHRNYDTEAMVHLGDSIYVFTKNRTKPFTGYTYVYGMPDKAGSYTVSRLDSFKTGHGDKSLFWIAGSALNPDKSKLVLLGYDKMWVFTDFKGADFFRGKSKTYAFAKLTQKESITFINENTLLITDELNEFGGGEMYLAHLSNDTKVKFSIESKEFSDTISLAFDDTNHPKLQYELFDTRGKRSVYGIIPENVETYFIDTQNVAAGGYVLNVLMDGKPLQAVKLKKLYAKTSK